MKNSLNRLMKIFLEKFLVPNDNDKCLTYVYGIPSKEEIAKMQHPIYKIDLKNSYKKYI